MDDSKKWYESSGVWGGVITVVAVAAGYFGYTIAPEDSKAMVDGITSIVAAGAGLLALYGRITATKKIK